MNEAIEPNHLRVIRHHETVPSAHIRDLEGRSSGKLNIIIRNVETSLATLSADDSMHAQVRPYLEEAATLLGRMETGDVTAATYILDRTKRLSGILESFDQAIRLRKVRTEPAASAPVERQSNYDDEQGIRQRYEDLLAKKTDLEQQIGNWRNFFRRGQLQQSLLLVTRDIKNYRVKFPFVLQPRDFTDKEIRQQESIYQTKRAAASSPSERPDALNKAVAVHRADAALELQRNQLRVINSSVSLEAHRKDSLPKYNELQQLLQNPPRRGQSYDKWYSQCIKAEGYLAVYSKLGTMEQSQTAKYWKDKLEVLEKIKPVLFGRTEWQKQYQHAQEERTYELHQARTTQLRTQRYAA